jgi:hypothetical protein
MYPWQTTGLLISCCCCCSGGSNNESKPVWLCVQAFEGSAWIMPTVREMRGQLYTGIVSGSTGIIYFASECAGIHCRTVKCILWQTREKGRLHIHRDHVMLLPLI